MEGNCLLGQDHLVSGQYNSTTLQPPLSTAAPLPPPAGLGFMGLLGLQDLQGFSSLLDGMMCTEDDAVLSNNTCSFEGVNTTTTTTSSSRTSSGFLEASEGLNQLPTTPNSSSISSASIGESGLLGAKEEGEVQVQEQDQDLHNNKSTTTNKQLKPKKANQKKQREPRFAFMTKSDVDHLEDGYRWRKYGQKAVKNSSFPRGYYRCTATACNVKKRVERSFNDPSVVITTYEGQHIHPSPVTARGGGGFLAGFLPHAGFSHGGATVPGLFSMPIQMGANATSHLSSYSSHCNNVNVGCLPTLKLNHISNASTNVTCNVSSHVADGNGLLQDIVHSHVRVNEDGLGIGEAK